MSTWSRSSGVERRSQPATRSRQSLRGAPPLGVRGHDAALAAAHPGLVEQILEVRAERREPLVVIVGAGVHQRVVLIGGEQALATAARAEHEHAPRGRRGTEAVAFEPLDGD